MSMRHGAFAGAAFRLPLLRAGRALGQLPLVSKQILEKVVAPSGGCTRPGDLQPAGDGVSRIARAEGALPADSLRLDLAGFRLPTYMRGRARTVSLAEGVAPCNQRDRLFVIHRHAAECLANVAGRG